MNLNNQHHQTEFYVGVTTDSFITAKLIQNDFL